MDARSFFVADDADDAGTCTRGARKISEKVRPECKALKVNDRATDKGQGGANATDDKTAGPS